MEIEMTEDYFVPPVSDKDKSKLEYLIHNYWFPEWYAIKIKNYIYNLENFDSFCKEIIQLEPIDNEAKESIKDLIIVEIIVSTMFLTESLAAVAVACSTDPKNIQEYMKKFDANKFYKEISSKNDEYYAKILSLPQIDLIQENKKELKETISDFRELLKEFKDYYDTHIDLFNSYKHGFRIFPFNSLDENDETVSVISYFPRIPEKDVITLKRLDKNPHEHEKLPRQMLGVIRTILKNHENKLKNPKSWDIIIPMRRNA